MHIFFLSLNKASISVMRCNIMWEYVIQVIFTNIKTT